jgi:hypothetical protein
MSCTHNNRTRYTDGYRCTEPDGCGLWIEAASPEYRQDEYMSTLWMKLNNVGVDLREQGKADNKIMAMKRDIGIGIKHENYEELITKAETLIREQRLINLITR